MNKLIIPLILLLIVLCGCSNNSNTQTVLNKNHELEKKIEDLNIQIKDMSAQINELSSLKQKNEAEIQSLKGQIQTEVNEQVNIEASSNNDAHAATKTGTDESNFKEYYDILEGTIDFSSEYESGYTKKQELDGSYDVNQINNLVSEIFDHLHSFEKLTSKSFNYLTEEEAIEIGNLGDQKLIHSNYSNEINTYIVELNYVIKKLDFELSIKNYEDSKTSIEILELKKEAYINAKKQLEEFIKQVVYAD